MEGWIKLWRKILTNKIYQHDTNASRVFIHLLLTVDKKTGKRDCGRFQLANELDMKPSTVRDAQKRLVNAKMTTQVSNNKYTTISICNWSDYQGNGDSTHDNKTTTRRHPDDTIQELRINNKELYISISSLTNEVCQEIATNKMISIDSVLKAKENLENYCLANGRKYKNYRAALNTFIGKDIESGRITKIMPENVGGIHA